MTLNNIFFYFLIAIPPTLIFIYKKRISDYLKIYDYPDNKRKIHNKPISKIGGIIFFSFIILYIIISYIFEKDTNNIVSLSFLFLLNIFFIIGLIDDIRPIPPKIKIILIITACLIFLLLDKNLIIHKLFFLYIKNTQINLGAYGIVFTIFCIFIFYNAVNFSDGANGILISLSIFWLSYLLLNESNYDKFLMLTLIILVLIFFLNIKNILFMGNSGSNLLSILISLLFIDSYNNNPINILPEKIFLLFFLPGVDCVVVTLRRIYYNKNPFYPDKSHFHHKLMYIIKKKYVWLVYILYAMFPYFIFLLIKNYLLSIVLSIILYSSFLLWIFNYKKK
jgi:UDP-GlcNAc:undecaprenyl-phosphate GlcNAc-1-phosphate transferase